MRVEELRVGNWVYSTTHKAFFKVKLIDGYKGEYLENAESIKLTEEILLKCGFEKKGGLFVFNNVAIWSRNDIFNYEGLKYIKYLHQLQNLYFALAEKELEFNK